MLDYKKLSEEVSKTIQSITAEELREWIEMDRKRMALAEMEDEISRCAVKPRKINGVSQNMAKPRKVSVRKEKEIVC